MKAKKAKIRTQLFFRDAEIMRQKQLKALEAKQQQQTKK